MRAGISALAFAALVVAAFASLGAAANEAGVAVEAPRVLMDPGGEAAIGLLTLRNRTSETEQLVAVRSEAVPVRLMHNVEVGETMRQVPVDRLAIPRGKTMTFTPDALHLRFETPEAGFAPGDHITTIFVFATAGDVPVVFVVPDE